VRDNKDMTYGRARRRGCKDFERPWRDLCVDKNLEDDWLERLDNLQSLRVISICEGHYHPDQSARSSRRFPHIKLRLKEQFLPDISSQWRQLQPVISNELHRLFYCVDTYLDVELKFRYRWRGVRFAYQEDLTLRINGRCARDSEEMDAATREWFERTVGRVEQLDGAIGAQICSEGESRP